MSHLEQHAEGDERESHTVLGELAQANELPDSLHIQFGAAVEATLEKEAIRFLVSNPNRSFGPKRLLVEALRMLSQDSEFAKGGASDLRERVEGALMSLFEKSAQYIDLLGPTLQPAFWSAERWARLQALLIAACGGNLLAPPERGEEGPTEVQLEVLDLCGALAGTALEPLTTCALTSLALACATDARGAVANHAAFAVVKLAATISDAAEAKQFAAAIGRIANDERVLVRLAVADSGPSLASGAASEDVRQAALEGLELLREDDNAHVSWVLARAEARAKDTAEKTA